MSKDKQVKTVKVAKPFIVKDGKLVEIESETAISGGRKFNGQRKTTGV